MKKSTVLNHYESEAEVARLLKITRQAVHNWGEVVPIKQAWKLERLSKGKLAMCLRDYR